MFMSSVNEYLISPRGGLHLAEYSAVTLPTPEASTGETASRGSVFLASNSNHGFAVFSSFPPSSSSTVIKISAAREEQNCMCVIFEPRVSRRRCWIHGRERNLCYRPSGCLWLVLWASAAVALPRVEIIFIFAAVVKVRVQLHWLCTL